MILIYGVKTNKNGTKKEHIDFRSYRFASHKIVVATVIEYMKNVYMKNVLRQYFGSKLSQNVHLRKGPIPVHSSRSGRDSLRCAPELFVDVDLRSKRNMKDRFNLPIR